MFKMSSLSNIGNRNHLCYFSSFQQVVCIYYLMTGWVWNSIESNKRCTLIHWIVLLITSLPFQIHSIVKCIAVSETFSVVIRWIRQALTFLRTWHCKIALLFYALRYSPGEGCELSLLYLVVLWLSYEDLVIF